jgi:toxin YoeB
LDWRKTNPKIFARIVTLLEETRRDPFSGKGKPEPLKHNLTGFWSRRINQEHRLVYQANEKEIVIISCKYHY